MDRFEALRIFVEVAERKSFTRAAEALYLQRSTVSMSIKSLEERLQARLLHRTTRRVELTAEGHLFYQHCQDVLENLARAENLFKRDALTVSGRLRIDMTLALAQSVVIPRLDAFQADYPHLVVELSSADRHLDLIHEGIDCAIRAGWGQESGLKSHLIGEMPLVNCVSPSYLERYGEPLSVEALSAHFLVGYVQHFGTEPEGFEYLDGSQYREIKMRHRILVNSVGAYKSACLAGLGICQFPAMGVQAELRSGELVAILTHLQAEPMPLRWVFPYPQSIPQRVQVFMHWFEPHLQAHLTAV